MTVGGGVRRTERSWGLDRVPVTQEIGISLKQGNEVDVRSTKY